MVKGFSSNFILCKSLSLKMVEKLSFNLSNYAQQEFPFPLKLINYVNQEADAEVKQKLDRCCKYFYKEAPYLIIDTLVVNQEKRRMENEAYDGCIDIMNAAKLETFLMNTSNIWITKKLNIFFRYDLDIRGNNIDVQLFDKIIRSDAKEISSNNIIMSFFQYKRITKSRNVEYLDLSLSSIIYGFYKALVPLEDVLAMVPNAMVIRMFNSHITSDTMKKLLDIPWKNKVIELSLKNVDGPLCPTLFYKFVKKYVDPEASIHVHFKDETDTFQKLYDQMVIESGENMPTFGNVAHMVKKKTKVQHVLSWMASIASIIEIIQGESALPLLKPPAPKKLEKITYSDENVERQYTAFPYPHMCYIRENADGETWKKLERTCKFFCQKNPYLMVDDLRITVDNKITLMVDNKKLEFENREEMEKIKKLLWITKSIDIAGTRGSFMDDRLDGTLFVTRSLLHRMDDFKLFTKSGKVKDWNSIESFVKNNDLSKVKSLNELLVHLPNVEIFRAKVRGIQPHPNKPVLLPQSNKIKYLEINFLDDSIQADSLFDVLKTSLAPKAMVKIVFREWIEEMNFEEFKAQMEAKLDTWKPQIDKPTLKIFRSFIF